MGAASKTVGRSKNLLIELGTEELPPKALKNLARCFATVFYDALVEAGVVESDSQNFKIYATPRRLAVWVKGVLPKQPDTVEIKRGPAVAASFDDQGNPTRAAEGFARSCGVTVSKLKRLDTEKGAWLVFEKKVKGRKLNIIVGECLNSSVKSLPIPKRMRWGGGLEEFVRPVHWLLALYGSDLVRTEVLGIKANRFTRGHRFHCPDILKIQSADRYLNTLKNTGYVIADFEVRQAMIVKQVERLAKKVDSKAVLEQPLLDEVTGLVEWPVAVMGEFDEKYLKLPREVLISTMADHQKYFHVTGSKGKITNYFATVSNIKSKAPKRVRQGNERVLRPRLADAEFFWNTDQKVKLENRVEALKGVLFHQKLGSIYGKVERIEKLSGHIAEELGMDVALCKRAASLCKADLVTEMVGEFPDLQGVIGKYYARNQGEGSPVADALDSHYKPRFAADKLPGKPVAQCVAIADRVDTLVGIFATSEVPTGDKDPYALRRAALGLLRIIIEKKHDLDLLDLFSRAMALYKLSAGEKINTSDEVVQQAFDFTSERMKGYFQSRGFKAEEIASVQACSPVRPLDFALRLQAVSQFFNKRKNAADSLASANKRISNILAKTNFDSNHLFDPALIQVVAEQRLTDSVETISDEVKQLFAENHYDKGFEKLSSLKTPVDEFFDQVLVMDKEQSIRNNRLALLDTIRQLFLGAADISFMRVD